MKLSELFTQKGIAKTLQNEKRFLAMIVVFLLAAIIFIDQPQVVMWIGFGLAGYSAIANDSIQTIGTFLTSNRKRPWWLLWLFIGGIFLVTVLYSWTRVNYVLYDNERTEILDLKNVSEYNITLGEGIKTTAYDSESECLEKLSTVSGGSISCEIHKGDVTYARLLSKGFNKTPESFNILQIIAPLFLMILTRMRMPVSTTFLLLTAFAGSASAIGGVLKKSLSGYFIAFAMGFVVFFLVAKLIRRFKKVPVHPRWIIAQWITSGTLWSTWIMQDAANVAVFLPRSLSTMQFIAFCTVIFLSIGYIFYRRGDRIQRIVKEKSKVKDIRMATVIDFIYAIILYWFKIISNIPMSTTWVFIGLLGGRELAMHLNGSGKGKRKKVFKILRRDVLYAFIGLAVSIGIAIAANEELKAEIFGIVKNFFGNLVG